MRLVNDACVTRTGHNAIGERCLCNANFRTRVLAIKRFQRPVSRCKIGWRAKFFLTWPCPYYAILYNAKSHKRKKKRQLQRYDRTDCRSILHVRTRLTHLADLRPFLSCPARKEICLTSGYAACVHEQTFHSLFSLSPSISWPFL